MRREPLSHLLAFSLSKARINGLSEVTGTHFHIKLSGRMSLSETNKFVKSLPFTHLLEGGRRCRGTRAGKGGRGRLFETEVSLLFLCQSHTLPGGRVSLPPSEPGVFVRTSTAWTASLSFPYVPYHSVLW